MKRLCNVMFVILLAGCRQYGGVAEADSQPQGAMASVANPYATEAALRMLAIGGHAVDAAIAAHAVLGLVEPQSSGLGGGGFMLVYERTDQALVFHDGRETAPAGATPEMFIRDGEPLGFLDAWQSGIAVGVPGAVALYGQAHRRHGKLPWATLFEPAIELAREGFIVSPRLANWLRRVEKVSWLPRHPDTAAYFYPGGVALAAGEVRRNPAYAETLTRIAREGVDAFYRGEIAVAMVEAVAREPYPGTLSLQDIAAYEPRERDAVCGPYRKLTLCSATPPSSGAAVIMMAGLYERLAVDAVTQEQRLAAFVDAQRLAYADRDHYFGDPDFVDVPVVELLDARYLDARAAAPAAPAALPRHGDPGTLLYGEAVAQSLGADSTREAAGTTHLSIVDGNGNAVSFTATVEAPFGSSRWAAGFLLNNEMTDFARVPGEDGPHPANAAEPGKRPRSSMSPSMLFSENGALFMVTGSPGGNSIPAYVAKSILGIVDWDMDVDEAVAFPNIVARGQQVRVEVASPAGAAIAAALTSRGYTVQEREGENSGLHLIKVGESGLEGAADPRREGTVGEIP